MRTLNHRMLIFAGTCSYHKKPIPHMPKSGFVCVCVCQCIYGDNMFQ